MGSGDGSAQPFSIHIEEEVLSDLRSRIRNTRWPDQVPGIGWQQGTDREFLAGLLAHWADGFDWRAQERELNRFRHFRAELDGVQIHFVHQRARRGNGIPLILNHGWPSAFIELLPLVPLLTEEKWRSWTDSGGDPARRLSREFLLTLLTIYWATQSITPSMRDYYDNRFFGVAPGPGEQVKVPTAVAVFGNHFVPEGEPPREWAERLYDVRRWTPMPAGGHFGAVEEPERTARDIVAFFAGL